MSLSPQANAALEKLRASWQFRAEEMTRGNETKIGGLFIAIMQRRPHSPPAYGNKAAIGTDGRVYCDYLDRDGGYTKAAYVCEVPELVGNFRGLADALKLTDTERRELFDAIRKWIVKDYRAMSDQQQWDKREIEGATP